MALYQGHSCVRIVKLQDVVSQYLFLVHWILYLYTSFGSFIKFQCHCDSRDVKQNCLLDKLLSSSLAEFRFCVTDGYHFKVHQMNIIY